MFKSRKAQSGIYVLIVLIVIGLIWITGLAPFVSIAGQTAIAQGATGIDAWFFSNLNLLIGFCWILAIGLTARYGL